VEHKNIHAVTSEQLNNFIYFFLWYYSPRWALSSTLLTFFNHTQRRMVELLWTSDQPVVEASTYTGQQNTWTQDANIHALSRIRNRDTSNQAAADLRLRPRGHRNWLISYINNINIYPLNASSVWNICLYILLNFITINTHSVVYSIQCSALYEEELFRTVLFFDEGLNF
jgi:hypothetical protein